MEGLKFGESAKKLIWQKKFGEFLHEIDSNNFCS